MALNIVWFAFFAVALGIACVKFAVTGDAGIFKVLGEGVFDAAKTSITDVAIPLAGAMIFFLGLLNIGEKAGIVRRLSRLLGPFFQRLFPAVPKDHPATGHMVMNFSANMLGLDNAATPFALKAMDSLQTLNPDKDTASDAQIMFLVLHTSGLTLIPLTAIAFRASMGSLQPAAIFVPCALATVSSTIMSILVMTVVQRIKIDWVLALGLLALAALVAGLLLLVNSMGEAQRNTFSQVSGNLLLLLLIVAFLTAGLIKKVPLFDAFIDGAKDGWNVVVRIMPYLVGMLVGIRLFRDSGALDYVVQGITWVVAKAGINTDFTPALPVALMRPFSGSGSRGMMLDVMKRYKPDSFPGSLASIMQNSAETTFLIIAMYFGSVGIKKVRYAIWTGLLADLLGVVCAIVIAYIFFHT
ncbi:nucleoside recognition domain-containing protein [Dinghuibacter silviterrae]|uniref:Spore maturation protein SpmA n=1 Tax=Dinghuibacter silviterrae TaxID=1539049 RepID=A0A4R8DWF0_9BACT|nr:spore maturation protein [Dinghuibacter silviterrae]TDX02268.1 spore maturation protein SpmA [Dinghuibacter silviterrae]